MEGTVNLKSVLLTNCLGVHLTRKVAHFNPKSCTQDTLIHTYQALRFLLNRMWKVVHVYPGHDQKWTFNWEIRTAVVSMSLTMLNLLLMLLHSNEDPARPLPRLYTCQYCQLQLQEVHSRPLQEHLCPARSFK